MSWESTALYYQIINREVSRRLGGLHSARMQIISLDFEEIASRQKKQDWDGMAEILSISAQHLVRSGAQCILIGTNTMHRVAPAVEAATKVPLIHIADATAQAILKSRCKTVGLLGTLFTMEHSFYAERIARFGITCLTPPQADREIVHRIIFDELCKGIISAASRGELQRIIQRLAMRGAEGIILGCTELPLILDQTATDIRLFDTTAIHAMTAVDFALAPDAIA